MLSIPNEQYTPLKIEDIENTIIIINDENIEDEDDNSADKIKKRLIIYILIIIIQKIMIFQIINIEEKTKWTNKFKFINN